MKRRNAILGTLLAGSVASLTLSGIAFASPDKGFDGHRCERDASMHATIHGGMHGGMMKHAGTRLHRMLAKLDLSDAQRDQVFNIVYKQIPELRAKKIALRKGRLALREASQSDNYDTQRIRELADAQAKTLSELMVMRAETFHKVSAVLTPEQREHLRQMQARRMAHRPGASMHSPGM